MPETVGVPVASSFLLTELNRALSREVSTCLRYLLQVASIKGAVWAPLRDLYALHVQEELGHAQYLANRIVMLGGEPLLEPDIDTPSSDPQAMLNRDIGEELADVERYLALADRAGKEGLIDLRLRMEAQAADEARHADALARMTG